jgi:hypothetical protein
MICSRMGDYGGGGVTYVLDVTDLADALRASHAWDPAKLRVTLAPVGDTDSDGKVKVGWISLYCR